MIIFTSICKNYTHKARTLAESVKQNIPGAKFFVCLTERELDDDMNFSCFDEIILSKDMWNGNFNQFIYKHSIVEASTSVKGQFFRFLQETYPEENQFVYLDPDCYVYNDFVELKQLLETKPIIVCPHLLQPGNIDMELSSTAHGVYNLGFLAVNNSDEAKRFINWWADRLYLFCYDDILRGIFTDQKWIDLAPCFFDVHILKHKGYDFATWSLLDCGMVKQNDKYYVYEDQLRFIHFSGYGSTINQCMKNWLPEGEHPFKELYEKYCLLHEKNDADNISKAPWSYGHYYSGEEIDNELRALYRTNYDVMFGCEDPFALENTKMRELLHTDNDFKTYLSKAKKTLKEEGAKSLLRKTAKVLLRE